MAEPTQAAQGFPDATNAGSVTFTGNNTFSGINSFTGAVTATQLEGCQHVNASQTLPQAIAAVSNPGCISVDINYVLAASATIPAGVTLTQSGNGGITTTGFTLTVNGPLFLPDAQFFFGTGTVALGAVASASPVKNIWFPGADWCAQVTNAYNALSAGSAKGGEIDILDSSAGVTACAAAPLSAVTIPIHYHFIKPQKYHLNVAWNIANVGWSVGTNPQMTFSGPLGVVLQFDMSSATTNAMLIDGSAFANASRVIWDNIEVSGNSNITNGLVLKGIAASKFTDLRAGNVTGNAVWCQGCLADVKFYHTQVNPNQNTFTATPTNGIVIDWISSGVNASNDTWVYDPDIEGLSGTGVKFLGSSEGHVRGGVINLCNIGISIIPVDGSITGQRHTLDAIHMQQNTVNDVLVQGYLNTVKDVTGQGSYTNILLSTGAFGAPNQNLFIGGWYNNVTINANSVRNVFVKTQFLGAFTDNGSGTRAIEVENQSTGAHLNYTPTISRGASYVSDQGTICTNGELALSAGWGTTATVTAVVGTGQTCEWTITSSGTGQAANPTITDTLTNALPSASTACEMRMVGGTGTSTLLDQTTLSATAPVFTFQGTPVAASTYKVFRRCGP